MGTLGKPSGDCRSPKVCVATAPKCYLRWLPSSKPQLGLACYQPPSHFCLLGLSILVSSPLKTPVGRVTPELNTHSKLVSMLNRGDYCPSWGLWASSMFHPITIGVVGKTGLALGLMGTQTGDSQCPSQCPLEAGYGNFPQTHGHHPGGGPSPD